MLHLLPSSHWPMNAKFQRLHFGFPCLFRIKPSTTTTTAMVTVAFGIWDEWLSPWFSQARAPECYGPTVPDARDLILYILFFIVLKNAETHRRTTAGCLSKPIQTDPSSVCFRMRDHWFWIFHGREESTALAVLPRLSEWRTTHFMGTTHKRESKERRRKKRKLIRSNSSAS